MLAVKDTSIPMISADGTTVENALLEAHVNMNTGVVTVSNLVMQLLIAGRRLWIETEKMEQHQSVGMIVTKIEIETGAPVTMMTVGKGTDKLIRNKVIVHF